jgi:hypothetical protein
MGTSLPEGVYRVRYEIVDEAGNRITVSTLIVGTSICIHEQTQSNSA